MKTTKQKIKAIESRDELPAFLLEEAQRLQRLLYGAELGVAAGHYSQKLLSPRCWSTFYCVDKWNDHHGDGERFLCERNLPAMGGTIIHAAFSDFVKVVKDASLDFIYIDGYAHTGQESGSTLEEWWPKLRPGGIFAGHDYSPAWPETVKAVDLFRLEKGLPFCHVTSRDQYQSWIILKP